MDDLSDNESIISPEEDLEDLEEEEEEQDEEQEEEEEYTEEEFYGLDIYDYPLDQVDDELDYLTESDRRDIAQSSNQNWNWKDCLASDMFERVEFVLDDARKGAWDGFIEEVDHIRSTLPSLLNRDDDDSSPIRLKEIVDLMFGPKSDIAAVFCNELSLDRATFVNFMANICLQMTYHETPSSLYDVHSLLKEHTTLEKGEYISIWRQIATMKKVCPDDFVGFSRRPKCLWELCEKAMNETLRKISVAGFSGDIAIALDDDKIWVESSGRNQDDHFKLRKVTHVTDNRKGIISHTAVTTTANLIIAAMFEKTGDSAVDCFKQIFTHLFPSNARGDGLPDLSGVTNNSDRGYTIESSIFDFLIPSNAEINNTCKRIMPFPFIWGKMTAHDTRTKLEEKGAPTLFIKELMTKHNRLVSCVAFRTGTNNISTMVTTKYHGHKWEGFCLNQKHRIQYEEDPIHGLDKHFFKILAYGEGLLDTFKSEIQDLLIELTNEKIDILTLEQGTADWHKGRQFSLTSSQSSKSFCKAFISFQRDDNWCNVAEYLHGNMYNESELLYMSLIEGLF